MFPACWHKMPYRGLWIIQQKGELGMLCFGGIFLRTLGLLSIFVKDIMWEITAWGNQLKGIASERTENWETMTSIAGVVYVVLALIAVYALFKGG
jgi:hypothetical protein